MRQTFMTLCLLALGATASAETLTVGTETVTEWKAIYGQVAPRDQVPARARIGGTLVDLTVTEGDQVAAGQVIAKIEDDKLTFQIDALNAQLESLQAQLKTAQADLDRGQTLIEGGVITNQRLQNLQTAVDVLAGQISSTEAQRDVIERQIEEGAILSPEDGIVLDVPVSRGSVLAPGEAIAVIGGGGVFLRLSVPERYADGLAEGAMIEIDTATGAVQGVLAKVYPLITTGRVEADVEVTDLSGRFIGRRIPLRLPVGTREVLIVPETALRQHGGLDFVTLVQGDADLRHVVVPGAALMRDGVAWREILTGLEPGDMVKTHGE